ncbi:DUF4190 domain-containing protein [Streptomyces sp. NBC_01233]|uniref:DUF4190 domain-containing protein n=1 Tax=Streptomyces sp. NBC_01233 TaxID=2903787 RepID=UPI002E16166C|nr:DUF4190 domain-containing protein [Streptomyces sp. NBC_01233]
MPDAPYSEIAPARLNGFALASFLSGLLCFAPLGIAFGIAALVQISKNRERGKVLAIAGLVLSVLMTGGLFFAADRVASAVGDRFDGPSEYTEVEGVLTDVDALRAGDCFNVEDGELLDERPLMYKIDCAEKHHGEVTAAKRLDGVDAPDSDVARRASEDVCWQAQDEYAMDTWALPDHAEMFYYAPSHQSWGQGDRLLLCVIGTTSVETRGSLRQDTGMLKPEQVAFLRAANAVEFVMSRPPEEEVDEALGKHQTWARRVHAALGEEAKVLQGHAGRPGLEKKVPAQLKEIEAARAQWLRASQAKTPGEFDKQWDRALAAMSMETEQALRGAYGLSMAIPEWLEDGQEDPEDADGGPGRGPSTGAA